MRWLLDHGADVNLSWGELDDSPLHIAAQRWNLEMVELLDDTNYLDVARQLIAAGSPLDWIAPENAPDPEATQEQLLELCRAVR